MWIREDIISACRSLDIGYEELSRARAASELAELNNLFAKPGLRPMYERLLDDRAIHDPEGWKLIAKLQAQAYLLLVTDSQGECGFRLGAPEDVVAVLNECPGFEFYITNPSHTLLVCFNFHDMLIGSGKACQWIESLVSSDS